VPVPPSLAALLGEFRGCFNAWTYPVFCALASGLLAQQEPEPPERWKQVEYPELRDRARQLGTQIFFADEAGVRSDYHSGTTWWEVGHAPVARGSGGVSR
jgi:hypothetical protein